MLRDSHAKKNNKLTLKNNSLKYVHNFLKQKNLILNLCEYKSDCGKV